MGVYWRRSMFLAIMFFGCLSAISTAKKKVAPQFETVLGIDLGTTYSSVGVYRNRNFEFIAKEPSWVGFTDVGVRLIGEAAKNQSFVNPERTIFDIKRFIGRRFEDKDVQRDMKLVPYKIVNNDGKPYIQVQIKNGETKVFSPEEISSMIVTKLKETAQEFLRKKIKRAYLTVPSFFNDAQRKATEKAGIIAGFKDVSILDESDAAASAYNLQERGIGNILFFDFGGGTLDVTISKDALVPLLTCRDSAHLGGEDFDQRVMEYFITLIKKKHGIDISEDSRALGKLRREAERAKIELSSRRVVRVEIESLVNGTDFSEPLTRTRFEEMNRDLFRRAMSLVKKVLEDAGLEKCQIDEIVLVGGSTRMPKVQQLLKDYFDGKEPNKGLNPDAAVAYGAAVNGYFYGGRKDDDQLDIGLRSYSNYGTPFAVGIETVGGVMTKLIHKGSVSPIKRSKVFTTYQDQQTSVSINVFHGEYSLTKDCEFLGKFVIDGIPPAPRGNPQIEVTFEIDGEDKLNIKGEVKGAGRSGNITITFPFTPEIKRPVRSVEEFRDELDKISPNFTDYVDFDETVMEHFIKLIKKKHGKDISMDNSKLRREAELAKRALSSPLRFHTEFQSRFDATDFSDASS